MHLDLESMTEFIVSVLVDQGAYAVDRWAAVGSACLAFPSF